MTKVVVIVVVYNKNVNDSTSLDCLKDQTFNNFKLIVWDNSPKSFSLTDVEQLELTFANTVYKSTPENLGLSSIYNSVLAEYAEEFNILVVFDQDSIFEKNYIENVVEAYEINNSIAVYVPLVYSGLNYHSPKPDIPILRRFWTAAAGRVYSSNYRLNSINSGNALNIKVLKNLNFKFDEKLRFYGVDNFLFRYIYKHDASVFVMKKKLKQSLATREISNNYELYARYVDVIEAYRQVYFPCHFNLWKIFAALHIFMMFCSKREKFFLKLFRLL
jgi:GT2 family glycosyltransferase